MPWTAADAHKHSKSADPAKWAEIANSVLAQCQSEGGSDCEGKAIRIANSKAGGGHEEAAVDFVGDIIPLEEKALRADGRMLIKVAKAGWGTSGYYSKPLLERDGPKAWPKGTHMYWDHPTPTQDRERPERSLRDLAAVTEADVAWMEDGPRGPGLYAEAKPMTAYRPHIEELAPHIGVSLRAAGRAESGEAEGRKGIIVQEIAKGKSIDFVTQAGLGGEIVQLFEAARGVHGEGDRSLNADEAAREENLAELEEARRELAEAQAKVTTLTTQLTEAVARGDGFESEIRMREALDFVVGEVAKSDLPDAAKRRLAGRIGKQAPPLKDGKLDGDKLKSNLEEAIRDEKQYLSDLSGNGAIRGFGESGGGSFDEAKWRTDLEASFKAFGLSESGAKSAAGRN